MEKVKYLLNILLIFVSVYSTNAQFRQVEGNVTSVPYNEPVFAQVIFSDINSTYVKEVFTDQVTGNYSAFIPVGTYKQEINVLNNYKYLDSNFVVTVNRTDSIETVEYFNTQSLIHTNGMFLIKILTGTIPWFPDLEIEIWKHKDRPIKIFADSANTPNQGWRESFEFAVDDIETKFNLPGLYQEVSAIPDTGIQIEWAQTPGGFLGECHITAGYPDDSPMRAHIWINPSFPANNSTMLREMMRALIFDSMSQDPQMIMYYYYASAGTVHPGEGEVGKRIYRFKHIPKDMVPYDTTVVTTITTVNEEKELPEAIKENPNIIFFTSYFNFGYFVSIELYIQFIFNPSARNLF